MKLGVSSNERVVITGLGVVCGESFTWQNFWMNLQAGISNVKAWDCDDLPSDFPIKYAAPVHLEKLADLIKSTELGEPQENPSLFARFAAHQAFIDAKLDQFSDLEKRKFGVVIGSGMSQRVWSDMLPALQETPPSWQPVMQQVNDLSLYGGLTHSRDEFVAKIARHVNAQGPSMNITTACASATHAIGLAFRMIRRGECNLILTGGTDSILNPGALIGLNLLGALASGDKLGDALSRPFDKKRCGLVPGEGSGMLVLESLSHAKARGATIYAEICGFGSSMDAYRVTAPHLHGVGASLAMSRALDDAKWLPSSIQHINAHATSTQLNDVTETKAIKEVFREHQHYRSLSITANKSMIAHLIAAAGAPEIIATALSLRDQVIPPIINVSELDEHCDLQYCLHEKAFDPNLHRALSNSFGFGGLNTSVALARYEA